MDELFVDRFGFAHHVTLYGSCTYEGIFFDLAEVAKAFGFKPSSITRNECRKFKEGQHYEIFKSRDEEGKRKYVTLLTRQGFELAVYAKMKSTVLIGELYSMHLGDGVLKYGFSTNVDVREKALRIELYSAPQHDLLYSVRVRGIMMGKGELHIRRSLDAFHIHLERKKKQALFGSTELCKLTTLKDFDRIIECMNAQQKEYLDTNIDEVDEFPFDQAEMVKKLHIRLQQASYRLGSMASPLSPSPNMPRGVSLVA